jgi:hypothetical protein
VIIIKARLLHTIADCCRFASGFAITATTSSAATPPTARTRPWSIIVAVAIAADGHLGIETIAKAIVDAITRVTIGRVACVAI